MKRAQKLFGQKMHSILENMEMVACRCILSTQPGTDLVWLENTKYIIDNDLHDKAFLNDWVDNYEDYYKSELFTMDFAEETTGILKNNH